MFLCTQRLKIHINEDCEVEEKDVTLHTKIEK
jgi:hypothetical protein